MYIFGFWFRSRRATGVSSGVLFDILGVLFDIFFSAAVREDRRGGSWFFGPPPQDIPRTSFRWSAPPRRSLRISFRRLFPPRKIPVCLFGGPLVVAALVRCGAPRPLARSGSRGQRRHLTPRTRALKACYLFCRCLLQASPQHPRKPFERIARGPPFLERGAILTAPTVLF